MRWIKWGLIPVFALMQILTQTLAHADSTAEVERHVKSAFIYQFTKFIRWPANTEPFIISVIDDQEQLDILKSTLENKTVGDRTIKVQSGSWASSVSTPGEILVFPKKVDATAKTIIDKLRSKPCLIVAQSEGLAAAGATINFFVLDDKIKFELNHKALLAKSLTIDEKLLKLAKIVE